MLESINRRLTLLEPWLAGGKAIGRITSADQLWSGVVLRVDRARIVVPVTQETADTESTVIKRQDWGVSWNRVLESGGMLVGDEVKIALDVELVKAA